MTQLVLVDDHRLVRSGFRLILEAQKDITVIAEAENGQAALAYLAQGVHPDVILTDIHMDGMSSIQFIQQVKQQYAEVKLIVLSMDDKFFTVQEALSSCADGYLLKSSHAEEILFGIQQVQRGIRYISSALSINLISNSVQFTPTEADRAQVMARYDISERDMLVLELIAQGYTNAEIADQIFLSKRTVEGHRQQLIEKTKSKNTAGLVRFGFQNKLLV
ncbi:response regulator [Sphingobacterium thalpophilum]|uniref:response regulator transcription factor n=1 Tax=Sphingobacterium TaxID=28453 RepID=UPI002244BCFA|nr:response regulator transcription factor [Sphingobacterium sp. InxBP1]MCW8311888.1 response regulator transcription factor [Sphingobacterium sp. InxBP1]